MGCFAVLFLQPNRARSAGAGPSPVSGPVSSGGWRWIQVEESLTQDRWYLGRREELFSASWEAREARETRERRRGAVRAQRTRGAGVASSIPADPAGSLRDRDSQWPEQRPSVQCFACCCLRVGATPGARNVTCAGPLASQAINPTAPESVVAPTSR